MRQKENQAPESTLAPKNIARLMQNLRRGSTQAAGQLIAAFYPELRRMARARMKGERTPHTWQPTIIVNELYLEMVRIKALRPGDGTKTDREAFLGLASHIMRRMLIHHARPLYRRAERAEMSDDLTLKSSDVAGVADVENLLDRLAGIDPQLRTIVEMRVFEDRPIQEIASELNCATRTVDRRWAFARKWLQQQLSTDSPESGL